MADGTVPSAINELPDYILSDGFPFSCTRSPYFIYSPLRSALPLAESWNFRNIVSKQRILASTGNCNCQRCCCRAVHVYIHVKR